MDLWPHALSGFFSNQPVRTALAVSTITALVSALVGVFAVIRGQSFAGHAFSGIGAAGGSGAVLVGLQPLIGFVSMNVAAAVVMEMIGLRRARGRNLATGIVLGVSLGLSALFLSLDMTHTSRSGTTISILFGSLFTVDPSLIPAVAVIALVVAGLIAALYRPLLLTSVSSELAFVRGVPVRLVGIGYLVALALAVSLAAVTIGAILSTALLVGPAATVLHLTKRTGAALAAAAALGVASCWIGIAISYASASWSTDARGWPVSFCIVAVVFVFYLSVSYLTRLRHGFVSPHQQLVK
ncbi:MAG: metal ABC transporter permease [Myxococcota bacterium]